ncbi:hypothetical protein Tco_0008085 [Tanacetum coccineum]
MTDKYCPRNEMKKLEAELWNLKVKGTDVTGYNQRFQELALLYVRMFPEESDKVERYVGGLPDMIHGSVVASKPKTMQEATEMATELMDKKISTFAEFQAENKRKTWNNTTKLNNNFLRGRMWSKLTPLGLVKEKSMLELLVMFPEESDKIERYVGGLPDMIHGNIVASRPKTMQDAIEMATELMDKKINTLAERQAENKRRLDNNNQAQRQSPKRQNVAQAYAAGTGKRKEYGGTLPLCNRCKLHHNGQCTVKCGNCKKVGHMTWDCRNPAAARNQRTLTCYECGDEGHYRSDCPELKNRTHRNQAEGTRARGVVHALRGGEPDQDPNNIEDEIEA